MARPRLKYLLDTHARLWAITDKTRLGAEATVAIVTTPYEELAISDITLQEIGLLVARGKIRFKGAAENVLGPVLDNLTVIPISLELALLAPTLPLPHGDQFDRIITATARTHDLPLITKDANISTSGVVATVW